METTRKIFIKFKNEKGLSELSDKLFTNSEQKLLQNMREANILPEGNSFKYRKTVKRTREKIEEYEKHWKDITPFELSDNKPYAQIDFMFGSQYNNDTLTELLGQTVTDKTKSLYYPKKDSSNTNLKRQMGTRGNPQYPVYIISKGRSKTNATADHLIKMGVPFSFVIEEAEHNDYAEVYGDNPLVTILHRDDKFKDEFDTYIPNFDENKSKGSGPSRNFVWWHSKNVAKAKWHWIMDDNIFGFHYFNDHERIKATDGTLFAAAEDFVNRYDNIGISGLNYYMFAVPGSKDKPYVANTKIYSCLLINNDIPIRWAGRYNEDVDICIRALKEGYSTIQFDAFLANKGATQTMGGGNTDAFYAEEGTLPKSNMLMNNHPDITRTVWRFQRWHHNTNYDIFDHYKDRTIGETIEGLIKSQLVADNDPILDEMRKIQWEKPGKITDYKFLEGYDEEIQRTIKFYRYKKNVQEIIDILTRPKVLNADYYDYVWEHEIPDTEDNRIMKDLLALGDEDGKLFYAVDWDSYLDYVEPAKRAIIVLEMQRNKYLLHKDYEKFEYGSEVVTISEEDHLAHKDSNARMQNNFKGANMEIPETLFDQRVRGEIQAPPKAKFQKNLTARGAEIKKEHEDYTVMIHGSEDFIDEDLFTESMKSLNSETKELINVVNYPVDLMSANYALDHKMKNREFVPDEILHTHQAYRKIYKDMVQYANEAILFIETMTPDMEFLIQEFEKAGKPVKVITKQIDTLEDW